MRTVINNKPVALVVMDAFGKYTHFADASRLRTCQVFLRIATTVYGPLTRDQEAHPAMTPHAIDYRIHQCYLSSYLTGESPNTVGACSPARFVRWQQTPQGLESRLNEVLIDRYQDGENAGYPTLCKGRL